MQIELLTLTVTLFLAGAVFLLGVMSLAVQVLLWPGRGQESRLDQYAQDCCIKLWAGTL